MSNICFDPGHGDGEDHGASGRFALESEVALAVCQFAREDLIAMGHKVTLTREAEDPSVAELWARVQIAEDSAADVFVSVHCNSFADPGAHGMEVFSSRAKDQGDVLADYLEQELNATFPGLTRRGLKEAGYAVLKGSMPSALVEWAFISNADEEGMMADVGNQRACGAAIARAVQRFVG